MISQSHAKNREICKIHGYDFLTCDSTCDLTDVPCSICDSLTAARRLDTIQNILRSLGLAQSFLKGWNSLIWRKREPTHTKLSGTNGLNAYLECSSSSSLSLPARRIALWYLKGSRANSGLLGTMCAMRYNTLSAKQQLQNPASKSNLILPAGGSLTNW